MVGDAQILAKLRKRRETECFPVINRGQLWYDKLTNAQIIELDLWYKAWLDISTTFTAPTKPAWLDSKLNLED